MKKQLLLTFKILLGVACFVFLWYRLRHQFSDEKLDNLKNTLQHGDALLLLLIAFVLAIPNWLTESYKWKKITESIELISFGNAVRGVLAGVCIGNLTPGRFGEFAGRILYFQPHNRSKASVTHFVCGATQLFITLVFGIVCGAFWLVKGGDLSTLHVLVLALCGGLLIGLFFVLYYVESIYKKIAGLSLFKKLELGTVSYPRSVLLQLIAWSAIRYMVFSTQYILLLQCCGAGAGYAELFVPVAISFMLMSSIPMISFIEVAVRASIAVVLFSPFNPNELLLVTASTLLWFINLALPSVVGYFIILSSGIKLKESGS